MLVVTRVNALFALHGSIGLTMSPEGRGKEKKKKSLDDRLTSTPASGVHIVRPMMKRCAFFFLKFKDGKGIFNNGDFLSGENVSIIRKIKRLIFFKKFSLLEIFPLHFFLRFLKFWRHIITRVNDIRPVLRRLHLFGVVRIGIVGGHVKLAPSRLERN
jgi:hypothetical protein